MQAIEIKDISARLESNALPPMIILDITNTCNLQCIHCPQPELQASPNFVSKGMSWDHFTRIVDEIAAHDQPTLLRFAGDGEPSVHPRLFDMLVHAKQNCNATVNLTTNGLLLTEKRIKQLLASEIDLIDISLDALTKNTYQKVRRGGSYERLMANLFYLLRHRDPEKTKVMVSFVCQDENSHEADLFKEYWDQLVDYVMVRSLHSAAGAVSAVKIIESSARNQASKQNRYPCPHLWKRLTVDFDGNIKFCAHEWLGNSDVLLGNINDTSLQSVWQGKVLQKVREDQFNNTYPPGFICTQCTDWASSKWDYGYERLVDRVVHKEARLMPEFPIED